MLGTTLDRFHSDPAIGEFVLPVRHGYRCLRASHGAAVLIAGRRSTRSIRKALLFTNKAIEVGESVGVQQPETVEMTGYAGLLGCCGQQQQARDALGEGFYKTREHGFPVPSLFR